MDTSSKNTFYIDIPEAAKSLGISEHALKRWIRQGSIPYQWIEEKIVFHKSRLQEWANTHNMTWTEAAPSKNIPSSDEIQLSATIRRGGVYGGIAGADVKQVLESAANRIRLPDDIDRRQFLKRLLERETLASTGIGNGVAVPHPRTPLKTAFPDPSIFVCFLESEIDYKALDGEPVFVLFLMLSPNTKMHLQMLARLGYCLRDESFIQILHKTPNEDTLCKRVEEMENKMRLSRHF